ncbi:MAG: thioredoxin [Candidatus Jacksonbacteria bacterium]
MIELTKDNFEDEVIKSEITALVDFWAPWCGPCKMQIPILEELVQDVKDKPVKIAKINIDENQELAQRYNVVSIPTLAIFKDGELREQMTGVQQKDDLIEKIEKYI